MLPALPPREFEALPVNARSSVPLQIPGPSGCPSLNAIEALNHAIAPDERKQALDHALKTFSHNGVNLHDYEMSLGADKSLCLKLGYVANRKPLLSDEIIMISKCLLQLYQCSSEYRKRSFRTIGASELLPLLVQIWTACIPVDEASHLDTEKENLIRYLTQVFRVYAKLDVGKPFFIHYDNGKWLSQILTFISLCLNHPSTISKPQIITELVGLVKDLTFRCGEKEKEIILSMDKCALQRILFSFCGEEQIGSIPKLSELFTAIIWNLVLESSTCRQLLSWNGNDNLIVVKYLLRALSTNDSEKTSAAAIKIKRNAISAIGNIFSDPHNHRLGLPDENRNEPLNIPKVLVSLVKCDADSIVRRRAMRTIRCLASSTDQEITSMIKKENMVTFLSETISRNISHDDENDRDMQIQAFQTVNVLTRDFQENDWPKIETAVLQRIETTTDAKLIIGACQCLIECVIKSPWQRGPSCFSEMFWKRLETTASTCRDAHSTIGRLLLEIAKLEKTAKDGWQNQISSLTCPSIVKTLVDLLSAPGSEQEDSRSNALDVILLLLNNEANKRPLAESEDLLSGLVNLCLLEPEPEKKKAAKKVILELVPEL